MSHPNSCHRLEGLEADNLLAFLALLGLLRALGTGREEWRPRAFWDIDQPPLRPVLLLTGSVTLEAVCEAAAESIAKLVSLHDFGGAVDLKFSTDHARTLCGRVANGDPYLADLCAALFCDAATGTDESKVEPTPLAYPSVATSNFLKNFLQLSKAEVPEKRGRDPSYPKDAPSCIAQALFEPWERRDRPVGLRWDPDEAKRHAYQWRAPTKDLPTTQHGANRLAIVGLSVLTCAPVVVRSRVRLSVIGGKDGRDGFSFAWPIWRQPSSLAAIRALLSHPDLHKPGALHYLGVDHVRVSRRISLDRMRNFSPAVPLATEDDATAPTRFAHR
jgi:hypothetical protein